MIYIAIGLLIIVFSIIGFLTWLATLTKNIDVCEFCGGSLKYWGTTGRGRMWICNVCGKKQDGME